MSSVIEKLKSAEFYFAQASNDPLLVTAPLVDSNQLFPILSETPSSVSQQAKAALVLRAAEDLRLFDLDPSHKTLKLLIRKSFEIALDSIDDAQLLLVGFKLGKGASNYRVIRINFDPSTKLGWIPEDLHG